MMRNFWIVIIAVIFVSCEQREKAKSNPVGTWENVVPWDNNRITLVVRPDSTMLFKAEKSFCPGTKFFVAVGDWHIENDSILVMESIKDGRHFEVKDLFPELVQMQTDSNNVIPLDLNARLLLSDSSIYDMSADGKRVLEHRYHKIAE